MKRKIRISGFQNWLKFLCIIFFIPFVQINSQSIWPILAGVSYKKVEDKILGYEVDFPVFNSEIKSYEGKRIKVRGFIVPTNGYKSSKEFVLSALPVKSCYFCGGAGPETVIEVQAWEAIPLTTSRVELEGVLRLNNTDLNSLMFKLEEAKLIQVWN
ncbi:MAG: hypothetical protein HOP11_15860 [Saprospiraceae bacterium]|nr:hypothetical protein [Saprospiraceae bacterium]